MGAEAAGEQHDMIKAGNEPYPDLGKEYDPDNCWKELMTYYEGKDTNQWAV